jgi:hypothetical protein
MASNYLIVFLFEAIESRSLLKIKANVAVQEAYGEVEV